MLPHRAFVSDIWRPNVLEFSAGAAQLDLLSAGQWLAELLQPQAESRKSPEAGASSKTMWPRPPIATDVQVLLDLAGAWTPLAHELLQRQRGCATRSASVSARGRIFLLSASLGYVGPRSFIHSLIHSNRHTNIHTDTYSLTLLVLLSYLLTYLSDCGSIRHRDSQGALPSLRHVLRR